MDLIDDYLFETFDITKLLQFDANIAELYQNVFYSFSNDVQINIETPGIITHFLNNWKNSVGASAIFKILPTIITGSIIEGACLSRIFHLGHQSLELEADVMYIVGCIDEKISQEIFEDIGKPGFMKMLFSPKIDLFTSEKRLSLLDIKNMDKDQYIEGTKLKIMHQNLQPKQTHIRFDNGIPTIVSIKQKINGPSSEIVFKVHQLYDDKDIDIVLEFLEMLQKKFCDHCIEVENGCDELVELHDIIQNVHKVLVDFDKSGTDEKYEKYSPLTKEEAKEMRVILTATVENFEKKRGDLCERFLESHDFTETVTAMESNGKDDYFKKCVEVYVLQLLNFDKLVKENVLKISDFGEKYEEFQILKSIESRYDAVPLISLEGIKKCLNDCKQKITKKICLLILQIQSYRGNGVQNDFSISFDNVSCFYCPFWPDAAKEWKTRKRKWPSHEHIENIVKLGTYLVSKQSDQGINHILEWRWSFSSAEIALAKIRTQRMKYVYFIFKSLFYQHFKDIPGCVVSVPSYIAKTCMLHLSEQYHESWWDEISVTRAVLYLFKYLQHSLESGNLSHYFITSINLLASVPDITIQKGLELVSKIYANPTQYFRFNSKRLLIIESIFQEMNDIFQGYENSSIVSSQLQRFDYVTSLYENLLVYKALMTRCKFLNQYYGLLVHKKTEEKALSKMQHFLANNDEFNPDYDLASNVEIIYHNQLKETIRKIKLMKKDIAETLVCISHIAKLFCKKCDSCLNSVPCRSTFFNCTEGCDYDLCDSCYHSNKNTHNHTLKQTDQCSRNCYTQFDMSLYGTNPIDAFENVFAHFKVIKERALETHVKLGYHERKDMTKILKQKAVGRDMNYLLEKLGLKEPLREDDQATPSVNVHSQSYQQETMEEGNNKGYTTDERSEKVYEDHIEDIRNLVNFIEKRNFIKNVVYPQT